MLSISRKSGVASAPSLTILAITCASFIWFAIQINGFDTQQLVDAAKHIYWGLYGNLWAPMVGNPYFYAAVVAILIFERMIPAKKDQPLFSRALLIDLGWTLLAALSLATFLAVHWGFLEGLFDRYVAVYLPTLSIDLPFGAELLVAYLLTDWIGWFHHLVRHKVRVFWEFHALHHSQNQMNLFTNNRVHPIDYLIARTIRFAPMMLFEHFLEIALVYLAFSALQDRFNHSNIKTNLGIFKYVLVTPQSHRIHHSTDPRHADSNFGVTLSIWDHLFGTQYRNYDEYPETGVYDPDFPNDLAGDHVSTKQVLHRMWEQFIYPIQVVAAAPKAQIEPRESTAASGSIASYRTDLPDPR